MGIDIRPQPLASAAIAFHLEGTDVRRLSCDSEQQNAHRQQG